MSVQTTADDLRDSAKRYVGCAIKNISEIVVDEVWGYEDYNSEYQDTLRDVMNELIKLKKRL